MSLQANGPSTSGGTRFQYPPGTAHTKTAVSSLNQTLQKIKPQPEIRWECKTVRENGKAYHGAIFMINGQPHAESGSIHHDTFQAAKEELAPVAEDILKVIYKV